MVRIKLDKKDVEVFKKIVFETYTDFPYNY